jgi:hypothetical protein
MNRMPTVRAGTLHVNGLIVSAVVVKSGGTLGGHGTIGNVTVRAGGVLSPSGQPVGTLYSDRQIELSHRLADTSLYETLDPKFNVQFSKLAAGLGLLVTSRPLADGRIGLIAALLNSCYFLHFAGVWALLMNDLALIDFDQDPVSVRRS